MTSGGARRSVEPWVSLASTPTAQQPLARLATGHQGRVDVDAGPQAAPAHAGQAVADQLAEALVQQRTQVPGPLLVLAGVQQRHDGPRRPRRRAGCRRTWSRARPGAARRAPPRARPRPRPAPRRRPAPCRGCTCRGRRPRGRRRTCHRCGRARTGSRRPATARRSPCTAAGRRAGSRPAARCTPASPWIGSISTATVVVVDRGPHARPGRRRARSGNPGVYGPKSACARPGRSRS